MISLPIKIKNALNLISEVEHTFISGSSHVELLHLHKDVITTYNTVQTKDILDANSLITT